MNTKPATIHDVAKEAGVSAATVSRALSNPGILADATREAVFAAIEKTNYRVNQAARNLRMQRAAAVLVLVPDLGKPFYSRILAGLSDGFAGTDYSVLISDTQSRPLRDADLAGAFTDGRIDGVICLDGTLSEPALQNCDARGLGERIIFLCEWIEGQTFPVIGCDNAQGARDAIEHLHALGHRKIAHVAGPEGNVLTQTRRTGMLDAMTAFGIETRSDWMLPGDFSVESGHAAARSILAMDERPTAVFCAADTAAFGLISGLQAGGFSVPDDISVIGFDDIDMAQYYLPAITTIRQDRHMMGKHASKMLLSALQGGGDASHRGRVDLTPVELIVRDSTAPLQPA